jgi:hypothetical protein
MAKYWRLKISPFGGDLKGVFISLHSSKSDIAIFRRDDEGRPYHRFEDNVPAATALVTEVFRRYSKPGDILLPAQGSQKPGVVVAGMRSAVEAARAVTGWGDWNAYLRQNFERWVFEGDPKKENPRKQYTCEVRQNGDSWEIVELKKQEW